MIYLPTLIAALAIALCVRANIERRKANARADRLIRRCLEHDDELTRIEVDSFAAGYEACAELMPEVVAIGACGCERCRAEKFAIN